MIGKIVLKVKREASSFGNHRTKAKAKEWVDKGHASLRERELNDALNCARRALSVDQDYNDAYHLMAEVLMPGDDYITLLSRFHDAHRPEAYLEIGVSRGESLALASRNTKSIGIIPTHKSPNQ